MALDMLQVFHMNGGKGETSYAKNCTIQSKILSITKPYVEEAIQNYLTKDFDSDTLTIAELGCSSGPTALNTVTDIIVEAKQRVSKFMVYLVDLPGNDFNEVFSLWTSLKKALREEKGVDFGPCFIAALPGNFYQRLIPNQTLDFVHSSSSLHWLSQVPLGLDGKDDPSKLNKGKIYISMASPNHVLDAYQSQFRKDFISFLKCRSEEVVMRGRMVVSFMGRKSNQTTFVEDYYPWEFIAQALMALVSEGRIKQERVDFLNVPYYAPRLEEVKELVEEESSFYLDRLEVIETEWDGADGELEPEPELTKGEMIAKMHRAVAESILEHHFGSHVMDELFIKYGMILDDYLSSKENNKLTNLVVSLIRM